VFGIFEFIGYILSMVFQTRAATKSLPSVTRVVRTIAKIKADEMLMSERERIY